LTRTYAGVSIQFNGIRNRATCNLQLLLWAHASNQPIAVSWLLQHFLKIAFLTGKPYDLPGDRTTLQLAVVLSFVTYVIATWQIYSPVLAIGHALLDIALAGAVLSFALGKAGKAERFNQAFAGFCGANAVLNIATLPIIFSRVSQENAATEGARQEIDLIQFLFLVWSISVVAHIIRFSFDTNIPTSIVAALAYIMFAVFIFSMVFGV